MTLVSMCVDVTPSCVLLCVMMCRVRSVVRCLLTWWSWPVASHQLTGAHWSAHCYRWTFWNQFRTCGHNVSPNNCYTATKCCRSI